MGGIIGTGGLASLVLALMTGQRASHGPRTEAGPDPDHGRPSSKPAQTGRSEGGTP
jgi:hypothetical protein